MKAAALAASLLLLSFSPARADEDLLVFAAASLTEAMEEIGAAFEGKTGRHVRFSFAGTPELARQIAAGAPADVFFSADAARLDGLESAGLVAKEDRRDFLSNSLVVVVAAGSGLEIRSASDLTRVARLALADPEGVPAGVYARKWLEGKGLWGKLAPRVVPTLDVRACLAAVETGSVDAGIVYRTDAAITRRVRVAYEARDFREIRYGLAPLARSRNREIATEFVAFAAGPEGQAVWRRRGFRILDGAQ